MRGKLPARYEPEVCTISARMTWNRKQSSQCSPESAHSKGSGETGTIMERGSAQIHRETGHEGDSADRVACTRNNGAQEPAAPRRAAAVTAPPELVVRPLAAGKRRSAEGSAPLLRIFAEQPGSRRPLAGRKSLYFHRCFASDRAWHSSAVAKPGYCRRCSICKKMLRAKAYPGAFRPPIPRPRDFRPFDKERPSLGLGQR